MASFTSMSNTMDEDDELFTSILSLCETDNKSLPTEDRNDEECKQDEAEISQSVSLSPIKHATPLRISDVLKNKNESFTDKFTPKRKFGLDLFKSMLHQRRNTSTPLMDRWSLTGKSRIGKRRHDVDVINANLETISEQEFSSDEENTVCCDDDAEKTYDDLLQDLSVLCEKELTEKWGTVKTERPENKIKAEHQISRINLENILLETSKVSWTVKETTKESNKPASSEPGRFTGVNITTQSSLMTKNDSNSFEDADDILGLDDFLGSDDDDDNDYDSLLEDTLFQDDDDTVMYRSVSKVLSSTVQSRSVHKADSVQKMPTYKSITCTTSSSGTANSKPNTSPTHIQSTCSDTSNKGTSLRTNLIPACSAVSTTIKSDLLSKSVASFTLGSPKSVCTLSSLSTDSKAQLSIPASENSTIHSSHSSAFDHNSLHTIPMFENSTIHKAASSVFDHSSLQTISVYENSSRSNCTVVSASATSCMEVASGDNENKEQAMNVDQECVLDSNRLMNVDQECVLDSNINVLGSESVCQDVVSESDRSSQVQETVSESDTLSQDDQKTVSESDQLSQKDEFTLDLSKDSDELDEFLQKEGFKVIDDLKTGSLGGTNVREDQRSLTSQSSVTDAENKLDNKAQEISSNEQNKSFEKESISSATGACASDGLVRKNVNKFPLQNVRSVVDKVVTWQASCSEQNDVDEKGSNSANVSGQKDRKVLPHVQVHPFKTETDTGDSVRPSAKKDVATLEILTEKVDVGETPGVPSHSPSTIVKGKSASCVKIENNTDNDVSCVRIENNMDQNQNIVTPSLYHDYEAERRFIHGENDLMKEVMRKWGSLGIQTPDTNLSFSNRLRKTKPHRPSRLEGQKISTLWIESPDKHLHSKEAKRFRSDVHAQMNNINNLKQQLQDLNKRVREEVDQTMYEFEEKHNALDRVFVQRKHALNAQQQLELCQTRRHINPYMLQCQLLQLRCEHQHQRDQLTYIFNTEMNQLKNDHQEHVHMIRNRFEQRSHQLKSFIEQLANVESAQTDPQYGPHVLTQLVKGPCRSNNRQSSVVTVCLPADIATAIIKEDEIYDVHYVHPKQ
ncbi:uro-adherence factor A-like [Argopecten irradians]|uniref:uro-adherence factor A-like n=1 Tax=Argopecten irradians TaxID=31199 RepID=UPI0037109982